MRRALDSRVRSCQRPEMVVPSVRAWAQWTPGQSKGEATSPSLTPCARMYESRPTWACFLVGNDDRLEAPAPELLAPAHEAAGLPGEIRVEVVHEVGELLGVDDGHEKVVVVGEKDGGVDREPLPGARRGPGRPG